MDDIERLTRERDKERKHVARLMRDLEYNRKRAEEAEARLASSQPVNPTHVTDAQIEHMVQQFLRWKLPEDFNPDGGVQFVKRTDYGHTFEPVGTNLFDYKQAKAMVQHMLDGLVAIGAGQAVAEVDGSGIVQTYEWWDKQGGNQPGTKLYTHPADERMVEALRAKVEEIRARVEKTICPTFSSDAGDIGEQGRISRQDFDTLVLAALSAKEGL